MRNIHKSVDITSGAVYVSRVKNTRPMGIHISAIPSDQLEVVKVSGWVQPLTADCSTRLTGWAIRLKATGELMTDRNQRRFRAGDMSITAWTPAQFMTRRSARLAVSQGLLAGTKWMQF